jgi:hypothetical protein
MKGGGLDESGCYWLELRHGRRHVPGCRAGTGNSPCGCGVRLFEAKVSAQANSEALSRVASQA